MQAKWTLAASAVMLIFTAHPCASASAGGRILGGWTYTFDPSCVAQIQEYNRSVPEARRFTALFPNGGGPYIPPGSHEADTSDISDKLVRRYAEALGPSIALMPTIIAQFHHHEFDHWSSTEYEALGRVVAEKILAMHGIAGAQMDLEPVHSEQYPFYRELSSRLHAAGKRVSIFTGGGTATVTDEDLARMYRTFDEVILSGYDIGEATPSVDGAVLDRILTRFHSVAVRVHGRTVLGVPLAAAGEFEHEYSGVVVNGHCTRKSTGFKQAEWLSAILGAYERHLSDSTLVGLSVWNISPQRTYDVDECRKGEQPDFAPEASWKVFEEFQAAH